MSGTIHSSTLMENIERETTIRIRDCMGEAYTEHDYPGETLMKIKETTIDLAVHAGNYEISITKFYDFFALVRILNAFCYEVDSIVENHSSDQYKLKEYLDFASKTFWTAHKFIREAGKGDLQNLIAQMYFTIEANWFREISGLTFPRWAMDYKSVVFRNFLEPSDCEYFDTGFYGNLFAEWFRGRIKEKTQVKLIWNARCRATDVIDGLIDLKDDVNEKVFSPLLFYVYDVSEDSEKELIKNAVLSGIYNLELGRIVQEYSYTLLVCIKKYIDKIKLKLKQEETKDLMERTYKIIDLGILIAKDISAKNEYEEFYNENLVVY